MGIFVIEPSLALDQTDPFSTGLELLKHRGENPLKLVPEALQNFHTGLRENPKDERGPAAIIFAYTLMGGYGLMPSNDACDEASGFAQKLKEKTHLDSFGEYSLGRWEMWCGRSLVSAMSHFEKAASLPSEFQIESLFAIATIHLFRSELQPSRNTLEKIHALTSTPNDQFIWFDLCFGDYERVLEKTAALLMTNPNHINAKIYRARSYLALGLEEQRTSREKAEQNFGEAEKLFKAIYDAAPKPSYNNYSEYIVALTFRDRTRATSEYRALEAVSKNAMKKGKSSPVMWYRLAQIASALGLLEEAEKNYAASIKAREATFMWIGIDPVMKNLRESSSFVKSKMIELGLRK